MPRLNTMHKPLNILVTGGAGFIGSHFVNLLKERTEHHVLVVDNFSQGRANIIEHERIQYFEIDLRDRQRLMEVFEKNHIDVVVHFAALATITASVSGPHPTYDHNVVGGINLLDCMLESGVKKIIFSSSGSVYGEPKTEILKEDHPLEPINPYGYSKLIFERLLRDYHKPYHLDAIMFRYFNPAGCNDSLSIGEHHEPETHVIPLLVETLLGKRPEFSIFGNDYPTPDGTCIRDYIHVEDLVEAHLLAMEKIIKQSDICEAYNLGTNKGTSVMELVTAAEKAAGKKVNFKIAPRRPGDPSKSIANASKAMQELNWQPKRLNLETMILSCYKSFKSR